MLLPGLAVVPLDSGEALLDLGAGQSGPGAVVHLPQVGVDHDGDAVRLGDDLGCLAGACEVARVDGVERHVCEPAGEFPRLLASGCVQRAVVPALEAAFAIPVGLAVPCKQDRRHLLLRQGPVEAHAHARGPVACLVAARDQPRDVAGRHRRAG